MREVMGMVRSVAYAVCPEKGNLVRFIGGNAELYCPTKEGKENWVSMPHLNEIRYGLGDAAFYDEIDEKEAKAWMEKLKNG